MAVTYSRYKFVTVSLPKRFRNGRFTSETAVLYINTAQAPPWAVGADVITVFICVDV
jgi:hypothetical protein